MGDSEPAEDRRVIIGEAVADFSHLTSKGEMAAIGRIERVGTVIVPRSLAAEYARIPTSKVGTTVFVPDGANVRIHTGSLTVSGDGLGAAGEAGDVLIAAGQVIVTGPVTTVGYSQVIIAGQLIAPEASRELLEPRLQITGQAAWYSGDTPRIILEDIQVGPDFFRLLDHPVSLVLLGDMTVAPGVSEDMVREKITGIILLGDITAPPELVPVFQVLTTEAFGDIRAADGPGS